MVLFWILLAVACLAAEALGTAFFALFLALGFAAGAAATLLGAASWLQAVVAAAVAAIGVVVLRPLIVRRLGGVSPAMPGVSDLVGQGAITVDEVGDRHHPGHALLAGERWLAVAEQGRLAPRTVVRVTAVEGTTLVVRSEPG